ncbi:MULTISPECIES: NAD(P)H-binding protein [Staphylococcus]|uniref:NmrA family NAD(P)-binding protein n=2 Tax=Staphylococcus TaxID=1279 RepID=UPI0007DA33D4|nr:NAD(P)H-binding protein [Staphylococcus capitis]OAO26274.1 3-beta hydroxysteroid dehydrogenase [Staphylococcus capitis]OAO28594.1 3-beta hydroxysteroid dehydrogenase [Staphylococcus capitis]
MIVITGATGTLGRIVVEEALKVYPANELGVSVRDASKAQDLADKGVSVREGDFKKPETLKQAFENADQLLVISGNGQGDELVEAHKNVIEAAKEIGVNRILYTSQIGSAPQSHFQPMVDHYKTEQMLEESGLNFIAFRNGFYSANGQQFFLGGLQDNQLKLPKDGPVNWTTHEDLAEGMVKILQDEQFKERYPQLTASRTLTMEDIAKEYKQDGIERVIISNDEYKETLGFIPNLSEEMKQMFVDIFEASVDGDFDKSSSLLEDLLGRKPQDIVEILNNK